jgi:hypothetical protein
MHFRVLLAILSLFFIGCKYKLPEDVAKAYATVRHEVDFNRDIKPILSDRCFSCHGPDKGQLASGLRLDLPEAAYAELPENPGRYAIVPGKPENSELVRRILSDDPEELMPKPESHLTLSAYEKAVLIKWIEEGGAYKPHWAFIKPKKASVPELKKPAANEIDYFILNRLENERLTASPEADKEILLRRLSFDLTGLPPTIAEINSFLNDDSPNAYERQVDRLLASPHYGERMATDWLDVARFADSHGYTVDRLRDMSPWRDWVIDAFNKNLGYDTMIIWQLAGDLLPNPTKEQLIATAFNRNHQQNMEGGIIEEEFRVEYVADRINTTSTAFMAITAACARCHDHKFDPISQKEYFQMFSYFNNVKEAGQISWDDAMPVPTMLLTTKDKEILASYLNNKEQLTMGAMSTPSSVEQQQLDKWISKEEYRTLRNRVFPVGVVGYFKLDDPSLKNEIGGARAVMKREGNVVERPEIIATERGKVLQFNGDTWLDLVNVGKFRRSDPFSIGLWVNIPQELETGVIVHQGNAGLLYNFRGFHLALNGKGLELAMAHTAPYNAIIEHTIHDVPRNQWIHLAITYDGSGKAGGYKVFLNGSEMSTRVEQDNLYKDIVFPSTMQPALQFGAWERGPGLTNAKAKEITVFRRELSLLDIGQLAKTSAVNKLLNTPAFELTKSEKDLLRQHFFSSVSARQQLLRDSLRAVRTMYCDSLEDVRELMIMQEMPVRRKAYVLDRGQYDAYKEEVFPGVPKAILPMPKNFPNNRLGFAQWLVHPDHPLTARVAVNRYWQLLFGRGLVKTTEDFGNQGALPSHPELLDWLSISFRESGWNVKSLLKMIVMSATYRQSSKQSEKSAAIDPENVFLSHGPAVRLTAEMLRDNALSASGLLNVKIGGRSVYPYQPEDLWRINGSTYTQDTGSNLYRRALYTVWRRSAPNPTQATFDVDIRTGCIVGRQKTNTPLQALVTLNDPTFVEASKVLGERMAAFDNLDSAITDAFRKLTGRRPGNKELMLLRELQQETYKKFLRQQQKTYGWLNTGNHKVNKKADKVKVASCAVVANTIINADAAITKR